LDLSLLSNFLSQRIQRVSGAEPHWCERALSISKRQRKKVMGKIECVPVLEM
jgi:hypothetical protein